MRQLIGLMLAIVFSVAIVTVLVPATAQAKDPFADACATGGGDSTVCHSKGTTNNPLTGSGGALTRVADVLAFVGGIMVVIIMVIGGFKFVTSDGDSSKAASARSTIIYGLIGLVVIVLARTIVSFAISKIK
jgi:hypothetical protein